MCISSGSMFTAERNANFVNKSCMPRFNLRHSRGVCNMRIHVASLPNYVGFIFGSGECLWHGQKSQGATEL